MKIKFVPQDLWVGLYWKREKLFAFCYTQTTWYLCLIPCFPIIWQTSRPFPMRDVDEEIRKMAEKSILRKTK